MLTWTDPFTPGDWVSVPLMDDDLNDPPFLFTHPLGIRPSNGEDGWR